MFVLDRTILGGWEGLNPARCSARCVCVRARAIGYLWRESAHSYSAFCLHRSRPYLALWKHPNRTPRNQRPNVNVFNRVRDPPDPRRDSGWAEGAEGTKQTLFIASL